MDRTIGKSENRNNDGEINLFDLVLVANNWGANQQLEPYYGDDPNDVLYWQDDFEQYVEEKLK